ncbi:MAG TPA: endonuclease MutS2 [Candidatus Ornithomonoglobus merdipullorum]|uniref:Endonuclease MutS2 n=1 Tax=Candidatus Ornithomonoglobus merdipullorum TaxID=2840895 RepID=A0A9D1MCC6_9FIRM|nr:endonuclease MutS2 [Candidatus Ornithomonoglobus merdipullorum]
MKKVLKILEFDKILERLQGYTESEAVKKRIYRLEPFSEKADAERAQKETTEAMSTLLKLGSPPVNLAVADSRGSAKRAEQGGTLTARELMDISRLLYVARRMKSYLGETSEECAVLRDISERLLTAKALEDKINAAIISEEEIADDASAELSAIRRRMKNLNGKIKDTLNGMIHSQHYKKFLQDPIVTMRSDRYVIPVRAEYKSEVPGIVHDTSSTGLTMFIEPMSVVNSNNEIRDLRNKEQQEIERILAELSALTAENSHEIFVDFKCIAELDFIFAKGRLSLDMNAAEPKLNDEGIINFKKARHPLIDKDKVVANDISLGGGTDTIVVTGPNTGGKTVTLKTVGLLSIMAASGLHIPAAEGSDAAVFSKIYADIGDEQSIEQSLSTFSSHMTNTVKILRGVDNRTLALFDELGAGTDPTEGAALAIAILEHLRSCGAETVATTHYSELKLFALTTDGVQNASCEFDVATLQPTYKLLIGVPGKSNAFAISRRLGLRGDIIDRANAILSDEDIKFEDVITDLEQARAAARRDAEENERMKRELTELRNKLEEDRIKLKENKSRILEEAHREAKILVMDAKSEANEIIRDLEKMRQQGIKSGALEDKTSKAREKLRQREESIDEKMRRAAKPKQTIVEPPKNLKPGELVKIVDLNQEATVIKPPDKSGNVRVEAGIIKMDVHVSNLRRVDTDKKKQKELAERYVKSTRAFESKTKNVSTEVDVRGQYPEEAWANTEKFLDDCYLAGISPVRIVHGKGTGVLKKHIRDMLRRHRYVASFRPGRFGEGEDGVTVVELK